MDKEDKNMKAKIVPIIALILLAASLFTFCACSSPFKRKAAETTSPVQTTTTGKGDWKDDVTPSTDDSDENWSGNY